MIKFIKYKIDQKLPKGGFARSASTLMMGTIIAQAIPIGISPILTRIYSPEDFGLFAIYISITSILSSVATAKYEMAIMLPKEDGDSINIVALSIMIAFIMGLILFLIVWLFNSQITSLLDNPDIGGWLYFVPITVFLSGCYQAMNYWSNRRKQYKRLAISRVSQSGVTAVSQLGLGVITDNGGHLLSGNIIGQTASTAVLGAQLLGEDHSMLNNVSRYKMLFQAKRYVDFPKYTSIAGLINIGAKQIPITLIGSFFGPHLLGFFSLAQRMTNIPTTIVATAMGDVFFQRASIDYKNKGDAREIYLKTLKRLAMISVLPFLMLFLFAPMIFKLVFGPQWEEAGYFVRLLTPFYFIYFLVAPLNRMLMIAEKQIYDFLWQVFFLILAVSSVLIGYYFFNSIDYTIMLFSLLCSIVFLVGFCFSYKFSRKNEK